MARRGYPAEFRRRVIELIDAGRSIFELSKELDVSQQTIYLWRHQARVDARLEAGVTSAEHAELAAAKKRIRELETELAIPRRATELLKEATPSPNGSSRRSKLSPLRVYPSRSAAACWASPSRDTTSGCIDRRRKRPFSMCGSRSSSGAFTPNPAPPMAPGECTQS